MSVNRTILLGRVGKDPETKQLSSGKTVCNFSLATSEKFKKDGEVIEQTEWHTIVAYGKLAEIIEKYVNKGDQIFVEGKIHYRSYQDKDGNKKYFTEILAHQIDLQPRRQEGEPKIETEVTTEDDLPF